jgi:hypothetical protein
MHNLFACLLVVHSLILCLHNCCCYLCWSVCSAPAAGGGAAAASDLTEGRLAALDDAIRDALRTRRSVVEDSKALLLRLFK